MTKESTNSLKDQDLMIFAYGSGNEFHMTVTHLPTGKSESGDGSSQIKLKKQLKERLCRRIK